MQQALVRGTVAASLVIIALAATASTVQAEASAPTAAEPICGRYGELRATLGRQFGEQPASTGLADDGSIMQVFAAPASGTWTIVTVDPDGMACVLAAGKGWQQEILAHQGEPA
jgi:hypothetical protein